MSLSLERDCVTIAPRASVLPMIIDSTYLHAISPIAVSVRWYGLAYLLGFYCTYRFVLWMAKRGASPLSEALVSDFIFTAAIGTVIGGRLGYCIFYSPDLFFSFTEQLPFWGVLAINKGGMASHGGMIGIALACVYFGRKHSVSISHLIDLTTIGGTIGVFFGRIANFINGELVGRPAPPHLPWGVKFPQDLFLWKTDRLAAIAPAVEQLGITSEKWLSWLHTYPFSADSQMHVEDTLQMILQKIQSGDSTIGGAIAPLLTLRHPSQLYEACGEGALLFLLLLFVWRTPRKPGIITGVFFIAYAIVRIIGEQFRMPDPQIGFQIFDLTRGQILSSALLLIGAFFTIWSVKRSVPPIGGLRDKRCSDWKGN